MITILYVIEYSIYFVDLFLCVLVIHLAVESALGECHRFRLPKPFD